MVDSSQTSSVRGLLAGRVHFPPLSAFPLGLSHSATASYFAYALLPASPPPAPVAVSAGPAGAGGAAVAGVRGGRVVAGEADAENCIATDNAA